MTHKWKDRPVVQCSIKIRIVTWWNLRRPQPGHQHSDWFSGFAQSWPTSWSFTLDPMIGPSVHFFLVLRSLDPLAHFFRPERPPKWARMLHAWDAQLFIQNFPAFCFNLFSIVLFPPFVFFFPPFFFLCFFSFLPHNSKVVVLLQIELVASDLSSHSESCDVFWGWCHF